MDDLERLEAGIRHAVEEALAAKQENGDEVEDELVEDASRQNLPNGGGAAGDVDASLACDGRRALEGRVEAVGDEVERRPAGHVDRLVLVMRKDKDGSVVRRVFSPPTP